MASAPHVPMHGSMHLLLMHDLVGLHSVFSVHSGRQPMYGSPKYSFMHVQMALSHFALAPHGDGSHGLYVVGGSSRSIISIHCVNGSPVKCGRHVQLGI